MDNSYNEQLQEDEKMVMDYLGYYKEEFIQKGGKLKINTEYPRDDFRRYFITIDDSYDLGNFLKRVTDYRVNQLSLLTVETITSYLSYQKRVVTDIVCSHPKVSRVWLTGSTSALQSDTTMYINLHMILKDGSRKDFHSDNYDKVIEEAENFLKSLA